MLTFCNDKFILQIYKLYFNLKGGTSKKNVNFKNYYYKIRGYIFYNT